MCSDHVGLESYWPVVNQITTEVPQEDQKIIIDMMFEHIHNRRNDHTFDIDNLESIDDDDFHAWFGFDKEQFGRICEYTEHCAPKHIAVLLCKMRTYLSNKQLSFLFGCGEQTVADHMKLARSDLLKNLVPRFLNSTDRNVVLSHNTPMAKALFEIGDENGAVCFDAT